MHHDYLSSSQSGDTHSESLGRRPRLFTRVLLGGFALQSVKPPMFIHALKEREGDFSSETSVSPVWGWVSLSISRAAFSLVCTHPRPSLAQM